MTPANDDRRWALSSRAWFARRRAIGEWAINLAGAAVWLMMLAALVWAAIGQG